MSTLTWSSDAMEANPSTERTLDPFTVFETPLFWVAGIEPHRLALSPRPRGGEDLRAEVVGWKNAGVGIVVSLLEATEVRELELREEPSLCRELGLAFHSFPIRDRGAPESVRELSALIAELHRQLLAGTAIAIHCRAGIGRTGLVAGSLLRRLGFPTSEVFHLLSRSRGVAVPDTEAQVQWVEKYARSSAPGI
ncbi:MAG: dual specificity protein phosphatase family protein [Luteimonas sp.]|nr:dual specificity protein phosphatase family protein [Luteimonas sp.]